MLRSLSIARQLGVLVAAFVAMTALSVALLSYSLSQLTGASKRSAATASAKIQALFGVVDALADVQSGMQKLIRSRDPDEIEQLIQRVQKLSSSAQERVAAATSQQSTLAGALGKLLQANEHVTVPLLRGENAAAQQIYIEESSSAFAALMAEVQKVQVAVRQALDEDAARTAASGRRTQIFTYSLVAVTVAVLLAVSALLVGRIRRQLRRAVDSLSASADQMASAAGEVANASQQLAQGSSEQALSLQNTTGSAERVRSVTQTNAERARSAAELMAQTSQVVGDADHRLESMLESMKQINSTSEKISQILRAIDDIAFQTNILALNAAVEAARAGESGMGFAVVADEVRGLAHRSAQAAKDTAGLIEQAISSSREGSDRLSQVAKTIASINASASEAKQLVDQVSASNHEQAVGVGDIARLVLEIEKVTQRTASTAEETAGAGQQLSAESEALRKVVAELSILVGGA
jgi:hypothetical protein